VSKVELFVATSECSPVCRDEVWAIHPDGRRLELSNGVVNPAFAFSPDGLQIAVGGGGLWLLMTGMWRSVHYAEFTAPAFAQDGALFVRQHGKSDTVFQLFYGGQAALIVSEAGKPTGEEPLPVSFEDGGKTVVTEFARKGGDKTVRTAR
jgi:hypothetical protein